MIDTNVLISAILFPSSQLSKLFLKVTSQYNLVLCSHIIEELHEVFNRKFEGKIKVLEKFLCELSFELCYTPKDFDSNKYPYIRDRKDYPIIVTAIIEDVDIIVTGDKDFLESDIERPEILTPREFLEKY